MTSYWITIEYGDHERFRIPKETIYRTDNQALYPTLAENQILASRKNDPFWTSIGSFDRDIINIILKSDLLLPGS